MAFSRWDPLQDLLALQERMTRLADGDAGAQGWLPPVDVYETPEGFVITVELPGLSREDVKLEVHEGRLTLRGDRPAAARGEQYLRVERGHGQFVRTFALPEAIDAEAISADLRGGVLSIAIPKAGAVPERRVEVR